MTRPAPARMTIIPAIDLKDGHCVRLQQGRADASKTYGDDPVAMARHWVEEGGERLHVVDLNGAFSGQPVHTELIGRIVAAVNIPVQVGGGVRTNAHFGGLLDVGVDRVIVGTRAVEEPEALKDLVKEFGDRLAVGIDAKDGRVQIKGWVKTMAMQAVDLARTVERLGVKTIVYTDTTRDGMLAGVNIAAMEDLCRSVACDVIASGGVTSSDDVRLLAALRAENLAGVIVGKALYEGSVTIGELKACLSNPEGA